MNAEQNVAQQTLPTIRVFTQHDVSDAQMIMHRVCRMKNDASDPVTRAAWLLLSGIMVRLAYGQPASKGNVPLSEVIDWINGNWDSPKQLVLEMIHATYQTSKDSGEPATHPFVESVGLTMLLMDERDMLNVMTAAVTFVYWYQFADTRW